MCQCCPWIGVENTDLKSKGRQRRWKKRSNLIDGGRFDHRCESLWHLTLPACDCDTDKSTTNRPPFSYYFHDPSTCYCKVLLLDEFQYWLKLPSRDAHSLLATLWHIRSTMHRNLKIVIFPCYAHRVQYWRHSQKGSEASNFIDYRPISDQLVSTQIPNSLRWPREF